jgi:hypothetical protein
MDLAARLAVAGAAGMLIVGAVLGALSMVGIAWSRTSVMPILVVVAGAGLYGEFRRPRRPPLHRSEGAVVAGMLVILALTLYGLLSARESCGDLHFFWGPKAIRFHHDGGVTVAYLTDKDTIANPGYPLLLPLVYAWTLQLSRQFSWWAAILATALFLFGAVALVRGTSRDDRGALLMAATLAYAIAIGAAAGAGEAPLLLFETLTLVALTFIDDPRAQTLLAALGLVGAVMLKIEGAVFAIAVVAALIVTRKAIRTAAMIAAPAALVLGAWLWFVKSHGILEYYRGAAMPVYLDAFARTILLTAKVGSYNLLWLPWLVPVALVILGNARAASLPLIVALLTLGATAFYYIHVPDPTWWIANSAPRVLLTPLAALLIAATAANRPVQSTS